MGYFFTQMFLAMFKAGDLEVAYPHPVVMVEADGASTVTVPIAV